LEFTVIDEDGFRPNVGIILCNGDGKVFWGKRLGQNSYQFPQGGIDRGETALDAMYRELHEETGLNATQVEVLGSTTGWLRYRLPNHMIRRQSKPICIGQKQRWFLVKMLCDESCFDLYATDAPEFDGWRWVNYWLPAKKVVYFKRDVYQKALEQLMPYHATRLGRTN
jgi:putative (di)nucleoside polyphosphate hydrolase